MNLCGSVEARRIHRTFCASFLWEASGKGIAFCHTRVAFYFVLRLMRKESNLAVKSSLSPLACLFLFLRCSASAPPYSVQKRQSSN